MSINPDKSKSILFATSQRAQSLPDQISVNISGVSVPLCNYANSILYGIPSKHISRLQRTQNTLARVVSGKGHTECSSSILVSSL